MTSEGDSSNAATGDISLHRQRAHHQLLISPPSPTSSPCTSRTHCSKTSQKSSTTPSANTHEANTTFLTPKRSCLFSLTVKGSIGSILAGRELSFVFVTRAQRWRWLLRRSQPSRRNSLRARGLGTIRCIRRRVQMLNLGWLTMRRWYGRLRL